MFFSKISEKIAEVRLQPDHIRLRWVWGAVSVSMFFILGIWFFSMGSLFQGEKSDSNQKASTIPNISQQLKDIKEQAPSIKDFNEGISAETEFDYPASSMNNSETPQTDSYSDLQTIPAQ